MKASTFLMIAVLICGIAMVFVSGRVGESRTIRSDIVSLDREMSVSGHFVLGSGTVSGKPVYLYYINTPGGGYKLKSVDASICTIYQDENTTPYIAGGYYMDTNWLNERKLREVGDIGDKSITRNYRNDGHNIYDQYILGSEVSIHIPANSIVQEYKP
jgi:hypothetical protein